jgi:hypothetical protein
MPTLIHLLLVFGSLLLGLRVAMADALPDDTNAIETLTVEQARELVERFPGVEVEFKNGRHPYSLGGALPLKGLKTLDAEVARALAGYRKGPLVLDGLTTLDADTVAALAEVSGVLSLAGLTTLDADTARALAEYRGQALFLGGLSALDADTAEAFAGFSGHSLVLDGLTSLDGDVASAFAGYKCLQLCLRGLTTLDVATATALVAGWGGPVLNLNGVIKLDA